MNQLALRYDRRLLQASDADRNVRVAAVFVWTVVAAVTVMRAIAAFAVPMTFDEAYYWEWSRHFAFGYVDHPPMVAWVIAAFGWLGSTPGAIRIGFVVCGVVATLAVAACASRLARDPRAGLAAALAFSITPLLSLAFGEASPDGPYLAFWCIALALAAKAFDEPRRGTFVLLGLALAGAMLTRVFAFALLFGIAAAALAPTRRPLWRRGLWLSFAIAAIAYVPFLCWNATHEWATFVFSFAGRHVAEPFSPLRAVKLYAVQAAAYSPGIWLAALVCIVRPKNPLLAWTSIPLVVLLTALATVEQVEIHWVFGAFASLSVALGVAFVRLGHRAQVVWATAAVVPALVLLPAIFTTAVAPGPIYQAFRDTGSTLRNTGPFEIYTYRPLAFDVAATARARNAIVMTDGYGLSSVLDFYGRVTPVVIGTDTEGRESWRWYEPAVMPKTALFVSKEPWAARTAVHAQFARACRRTSAGPTLRYSFEGVPPRTYQTQWCEGLRPDALRILR